MQLEICKPGNSPINSENERNPEMWRLQRASFTAYGKMWGMECQGIFIPNSFLANIYITSVAQNDKGGINISILEEELQRLLMPYRLFIGDLPVLYGDGIYHPSTVITKSNSVKNIFSLRINSARIDIEHEFGLKSSLFKQQSVKHTWKLMQLSGNVTEHLCSIYFVVNCHTCVRGNKTSTKYCILTPMIENYLDVMIDDAYNGNAADDLMIERLEAQVE